MGVVVEFELPPVNSPQLEDGHTRIANELLEEIISFDFSKRQYKVVLFVIRKTYGWNKKADVMSLSQIVDGTRIDRANSSRTVNELCEMNVLLKQQQKNGQLVKLNKNYGEWRGLPNQQPVAKTATEGLPKQQLSVAKIATTKDKPKNNTKDNICSSAFAACWQEYPRKISKGAAEKAFKKLGSDRNLFEVIFRAIKAQKATPGTRLSAESQFIPHFSTWLNGQGWLDEISQNHPVSEWVNK
jgi:phage replication O-like protein O